MFEGVWVNDKLEGNGKWFCGCECGKYYIGQFKNGLKHGKGIMYNKNKKVMLEGDWVNGEFVGNGK